MELGWRIIKVGKVRPNLPLYQIYKIVDTTIEDVLSPAHIEEATYRGYPETIGGNKR
jgi:hypothetical protein